MSTLAAAVLTADRMDYWIRRHVIQYCSHPSQSPARDRSVSLSVNPVPISPEVLIHRNSSYFGSVMLFPSFPGPSGKRN
jgi:hypothetical protein